jgi:hypothetical protein
LIIGGSIVGLGGAIGMAVGAATDPTRAAFAYLTAWLFALSIAIGALVMLMIAHATGARWVIVFRRHLEAIASTFPLLLVLFVPIALWASRLYIWVDPSPALAPDLLAKLSHARRYLNLPFWVVRAGGCLVLWTVMSELLRRWAACLGRDEQRYRKRLVTLSTPGLPLVALTLTMAVIDWLMSLTPMWTSTIFGLLFWSGGFLAALCVVAVTARAARRVPTVAASISADSTGALGRMILAFLAFWAYMEFSQGLIIWIANKPSEVPWYVARGAAAWGGVLAILVVGHFVLPLFPLLSRSLKRRSMPLAIIGGWLVVMHYVDVYWLVMPVLHSTVSVHWLDLAAPCSIVGLAVAVASARTRSLLPSEDPRLPASLAYEARE